jgi:hypothetical protein
MIGRPKEEVTKDKVITFRAYPEEHEKFQIEAQKRGLNISDFIRYMKEHFEPLPKNVEEIVLELSKTFGMSVNDVISCAVLSMVVRLEVEENLFGHLLLNPLIIELGGDGWDGVPRYFRRKYQDALFSGMASLETHEKHLQAIRKDYQEKLAKHRAKMKKAKKKKAEKKKSQE